MAAALDFRFNRFHRLGERNDLLVFTEFGKALAAIRRVLLLLLPLRHAYVQRAVVIDPHIHVGCIDLRQVGSQLVMILPVAQIGQRCSNELLAVLRAQLRNRKSTAASLGPELSNA
jgi:hypothetical protein